MAEDVIKLLTEGERKEKIADLTVLDAGSDTGTIPPRGWLLGNIFCRGYISSLMADGGVGKTALRIAQCLELARGKSLTGDYVFQRCRVLFITLEDDLDELRRREKLCEQADNSAEGMIRAFEELYEYAKSKPMKVHLNLVFQLR